MRFLYPHPNHSIFLVLEKEENIFHSSISMILVSLLGCNWFSTVIYGGISWFNILSSLPRLIWMDIWYWLYFFFTGVVYLGKSWVNTVAHDSNLVFQSQLVRNPELLQKIYIKQLYRENFKQALGNVSNFWRAYWESYSKSAK